MVPRHIKNLHQQICYKIESSNQQAKVFIENYLQQIFTVLFIRKAKHLNAGEDFIGIGKKHGSMHEYLPPCLQKSKLETIERSDRFLRFLNFGIDFLVSDKFTSALELLRKYIAGLYKEDLNR